MIIFGKNKKLKPMKKLLLLLLCVPLMFTTCKKEDDTPDNNNGTFLENQDGTVWVCQTNDEPGLLNFGENVNNPQNLLTNIGFYNASNFLCMKSDVLNPYACTFLTEGTTQLEIDEDEWYLLETSMVSQTDNELNIDQDWTDEGIVMKYKFVISSANQMTLELECDPCGSFTGTYNLLYVKSTTETNLSCN